MKTVKFTVTGRMAFPLDMLRYDRCWPASVTDVAEMEYDPANREPRTVTLITCSNGPTVARWQSFVWSVDPASIRVL